MSSSYESSGLPVTGFFEGEELLLMVRIFTTLVSVSVVSAWFSWKKIGRLGLFFTHWLAGLVAGLGLVVEDAMVTVNWIDSNLVGFIKALRFIELSAFNMFAVTNLAICVNLALVVWSHRTMSRVKSVSSPPVLLVLLAISMALAASMIPLGEFTLVSGTGFYMVSTDKRENDYIQIAAFGVEFFVGICMFIVVTWLLVFRLTEIKECWNIHTRIRFYFGLTLVGIAVNLGIGICGTINVVSDDFIPLVFVWSWLFRYIHVALDTIVLYGVLRERNIDERGDNNVTPGSGSRSRSRSGSGSGLGTRSGGSSLTSGRRASGRGMARAPRWPISTSKPVSVAPIV